MRKIESFTPTKTQAERQKAKKSLPRAAKFLIFVLVMLSPLIIWKALTYNVIYCNGIVMGQMELELSDLNFTEIKSPAGGEIAELYAEKGDRVEGGSLLAIIKEIKDDGVNYVKIRAKNEAVIIDKNRRVGDFVAKDDTIYGVLPVGIYWIEAFVPEKYINQLFIGQKAVVFTGSPRRQFEGKIDFIAAEIESMPKMFSIYYYSPKRVFRARISLSGKKIPPGILKFGMSVRCKIHKK